MEIDCSDKIYAFDTLYTSNQIQMLKIMIPYTNVSMRKTLAILIKYLEFQYMINLPSHAFHESSHVKSDSPLDTSMILEEIRPLCKREDQHKLDQISNLLSSFEMFGQMQELMNLMGDFTSNDGGNQPFGGFDLSSMLSPEHMALFDLFKQSSE